MLNKFDWLHIRQLSLANSARKLPGSSPAGLFCEMYSRSKWRLHGVSVHVCWCYGFQGVSRGWHTSIQRSNVLGSPHERWIALFNCQLARWSRIWLVAGTYQEVVERNVDLSWSDEAYQWAKAWEMTDSIESLAVLIASFFGSRLQIFRGLRLWNATRCWMGLLQRCFQPNFDGRMIRGRGCGLSGRTTR